MVKRSQKGSKRAKYNQQRRKRKQNELLQRQEILDLFATLKFITNNAFERLSSDEDITCISEDLRELLSPETDLELEDRFNVETFIKSLNDLVVSEIQEKDRNPLYEKIRKLDSLLTQK